MQARPPGARVRAPPLQGHEMARPVPGKEAWASVGLVLLNVRTLGPSSLATAAVAATAAVLVGAARGCNQLLSELLGCLPGPSLPSSVKLQSSV